MKRLLLLAVLLFVPAAADAQAKARTAAPVRGASCCDAGQLATIMDLNYIARVALNHTGPLSARLYQMNVSIGAGTWQSFADPNRAELIAVMKSTGDGQYWAALIDSFAAAWSVTPAPAPVPAPTPTPVVTMPVKPAICPLPAGRTVTTAKLATCLAYEHARANALEQRLAQGGSAVVTGDVIRASKLVLGNCKYTDADAQLQICGQQDAIIHLESNLNNANFQNPSAHVGMVTLSGDGGLRLHQNMYKTLQCVTKYDEGNAYQDCGRDFVDPIRETAYVGFDSRAEWSWNGQKVGQPGLGTQRLVLRTDEDAKQVYFAMWAEGWTLGVRTSTSDCKWCENVRWTVPGVRSAARPRTGPIRK